MYACTKASRRAERGKSAEDQLRETTQGNRVAAPCMLDLQSSAIDLREAEPHLHTHLKGLAGRSLPPHLAPKGREYGDKGAETAANGGGGLETHNPPFLGHIRRETRDVHRVAPHFHRHSASPRSGRDPSFFFKKILLWKDFFISFLDISRSSTARWNHKRAGPLQDAPLGLVQTVVQIILYRKISANSK